MKSATIAKQPVVTTWSHSQPIGAPARSGQEGDLPVEIGAHFVGVEVHCSEPWRQCHQLAGAAEQIVLSLRVGRGSVGVP
jgi:hypothetical protein